MLSKKRLEAYIEKHKDTFIKYMELDNVDIEWRVEAGKSPLYGCCDSRTDSSCIIVLYCNEITPSNLVSTILHELMHAKFTKILYSIKPYKEPQAYEFEERFISAVENCLLQYPKFLKLKY